MNATPLFAARFRDFRVPFVVDESLREGLERCMFPVPTDDLYRLFAAQTDAGIRESIVGSGPEDPDLFRTICENQDQGKLPDNIHPVFLVLLNCWDATYENFKQLPRAWIERATYSFGMLPHKREERLFDHVFDAFAALGAKHFKCSILNNFSRGITQEKWDQVVWQIDWAYGKGIRTFRINDSVGKLFPEDTAELCQKLVSAYPDVVFCLHCHNDRGLALANQLTSIYYGFQMVEGSLCGYGNRSGITPLEVLASVCRHKGIEFGPIPLDTKLLVRNAALAEEIFMAVPDTYRPVSGRFVTKANFGVLNIPDFLEAEMERDYFLNLVNVHPNTILKALRSHGVAVDSANDTLVSETMTSLRQLIAERHAGARARHASLLQDLLGLYTTSQLTSAEIAALARGIQSRSAV